MADTSQAIGWLGVPLAIIAGTMRGGTPFLFVSLGECLTEKSGKINLGKRLSETMRSETMRDEWGGMNGESRQPHRRTAQSLHSSLIPPPSSFQFTVWRSLRNAPPVLELLADLIQVLSNRREADLPDSLDGRIRRLLDYLRQHRCLIILDNAETVMRQGDRGGGYLPGYEGYGQLLQALGEAEHQSSVLLTSREKPGNLSAREGTHLPIRSLRLSGLPPAIGQELFALKGEFSGTDAEWQTLVSHYAGNPLALQMVASVIQDLFDGQLADFLDCLGTGTSVFGDIRDLLAQQINRLSPLERQVMDWLAIARKPVTLSSLRSWLVPPVALGALLEAVCALERRCLVEKATPRLTEKSQVRFTLQPAVMEYVTEQIIE